MLVVMRAVLGKRSQVLTVCVENGKACKLWRVADETWKAGKDACWLWKVGSELTLIDGETSCTGANDEVKNLRPLPDGGWSHLVCCHS